MFSCFGSAAAVCCFVCAAGVACADGCWCWLLVLVHVLMALLVLVQLVHVLLGAGSAGAGSAGDIANLTFGLNVPLCAQGNADVSYVS